jgi:hypothetical protein
MKTLLIIAAIATLTGCSLTVSPDGTRQWSVNGDEAARALVIISEK